MLRSFRCNTYSSTGHWDSSYHQRERKSKKQTVTKTRALLSPPTMPCGLMPRAFRTQLDGVGPFQLLTSALESGLLFPSGLPRLSWQPRPPHPTKLLAVTLHSDSASWHLKNQHREIHSQASQLYLLSFLLTLCDIRFLPVKLWVFMSTPLLFPYQLHNKSWHVQCHLAWNLSSDFHPRNYVFLNIGR